MMGGSVGQLALPDVSFRTSDARTKAVSRPGRSKSDTFCPTGRLGDVLGPAKAGQKCPAYFPRSLRSGMATLAARRARGVTGGIVYLHFNVGLPRR